MKVPNALPWIGDEEYRALEGCFAEAWITEGPRARRFHDRLVELFGTRHGVFAPNGTLALYLGLRALGIGRGDEVLVPDLTFIASANAVEMTGATPVLVDVRSGDFHITCQSAERWITPRTRAIMIVHLWGTVAEVEPILELAEQRGLQVIEDAAHAIGVHRNGRHAGSFGDVGAFSFFADKSITTGEGGFVVTDDDTIHDRLLHLRNQGRRDRGDYVHPRIGYNFRITDLQAAIGLVQLDKLPRVRDRKRALVDRYRALLDGLDQVRWFQPPSASEWIPYRAPVLCQRASELMGYLRGHDIEPRTWLSAVHSQPCYADLVKRQIGEESVERVFPNATHAHEHGLLLPAFPTMTDGQVEHVCRTIRAFYGAR